MKELKKEKKIDTKALVIHLVKIKIKTSYTSIFVTPYGHISELKLS